MGNYYIKDDIGVRQYCRYDGCKYPAVYNLYRLKPDGTKEWINVCPTCAVKVEENNLELLEWFNTFQLRPFSL